jgi:S1-C subfamily serine protease
VVHVGHDCDLALLTVDDEDFWDGLDTTPLQLGGLPELQTHVTVVGYPTGGENISITAGVVSRLDMQQYSHSESNLLAVQIDAAINSGNSGGPAFHNGKVIGIAFESLVDAENIGYIIPITVLQHYLDDVKNDIRQENYRGFGVTGFHWQTMESTHLRASLGVKKGVTGVVVTKVNPLTHAASALQSSDVILEIDDSKIADDGTVPFR